MRIETQSMFELAGTSNPSERAHVYFADYCNAYAEEFSKIIMGANSVIEMKGNSTLNFFVNTQIDMYAGSKIILTENSHLYDCGISHPIEWNIVGGENGRYVFEPNCQPTEQGPFVNTISNGGHMEFSDNSSILMGNSCRMVFDGTDSYLKLNPGTSVILGENSSLEFINGAYLDASGCMFSGVGSNVWEGLKFDNAGASTVINNCTFTGARNPVYITNDASHSFEKKVIENNTFYLPVAPDTANKL